MRCLNSLVYTHWVNRSDVPLFGKTVEFVPHKRSLAGSGPNQAARHHDNRPARETIADAITTLQNNTRQGPTLEDMQEAMQGVEKRIEARIAEIGLNINQHTSQTAGQSSTHITNQVAL